MNAAERAAAATSAAAAIAEVNGTVERVSGVVRRRIRGGLSVLGPAGTLPMDAVDAAHTRVHAAIGGGTTLAGTVTAAELARSTAPDAPSIVEDEERVAHVAALGAAFGDILPDALAPEMRTRVDSHQVGHSDRMVVFVHGLGGHDLQWSGDYSEAARAAGFTPIFVRYTTGHPVAENGAQFSRTLEQLVTTWPTPVERIILVGHSMGGLVAASAVEHADDTLHWPELVTDVVTLGTPHKGAPLERFSDRVLRLIARSELAAPIAELGHRRSQGIKDLAHGIAAALPDRISHHAVVAHLGTTPASPTSRILGDGMVRPDSAAGHAPTSDSVTVIEIAGSGHLSLLDHPAVTDLLATLFDR